MGLEVFDDNSHPRLIEIESKAGEIGVWKFLTGPKVTTAGETEIARHTAALASDRELGGALVDSVKRFKGQSCLLTSKGYRILLCRCDGSTPR